MTHFPIIVLYLYEPFLGTKLYPESYFDKSMLLILIIISSILIHKFIEKRHINNIGKIYFISLLPIFILIGGSKVIPSVIYTEREQNIFSGLEDRATYRCGKLTRITNPSDISCKLNSENFDQSVLLVGNSHADAIKKTFQYVATRHGFNTFF